VDLKIIKYILSLVLVLVVIQTTAQDNDVIFTARFQDVPFSEFAATLEQQAGVRFYYLNHWIQDMKISVSGDQVSLQNTLQEAFIPSGLLFYISEDRQVFITGEQSLVTTLPEFSIETNSSGITQDHENENQMTMAEGKYFETRKNGTIETIVLGQESNNLNHAESVINGKMVDGENGEPLIGATIYIKKLNKGTVTDTDGRFSIVLRPGKYLTEFNCLGMKSLQYSLEIRSGGYLDIVMERSLIPISEVVIMSDGVDNVRGSQMGFERLDIKNVKQIPVVFGEKDILQVARLLPGVQSVGEGSSGFNVRGSPVDQNMIYVNNVPVYNSSHLFGFFSSFNPDMVKDFSLFKSNLPVKYGGRISSFLDITTRQGNLNKYTARGGISPVTGRIAVEGPLVKNKGAFVMSARSTHSDWILKRLHNPQLRSSEASFYDLAGSLTFEHNENNLVKAFGYYSNDKFSLGTENQYAYSNAGASINLKHRFNSRITSDLAAVYGEYAFSTIDKAISSYAYQHDYRIGHYEARADCKWLSLGSHTLTFGGNIVYYRLNRGRLEPYGELSARIPTDLGIEDGLETAIYIADDINLTSRLTLYGGLRLNLFMAFGPAQILEFEKDAPLTESNITDTIQFNAGQVVKRYSGLEPRVAMKYLLGSNNSVKISYNRVRQFLFMLSNTFAISPTDQWKLCDYNILPPYADQVSAGYYHDFRTTGLSTSLEVYHKWISNIVEYRDGASFITSPYSELQVLQGKQKAWGMEMMVKKNAGKLNGWLAYTYSRSIVQVDGSDKDEQINKGKPYSSNYDRPHNLNLVANYRVNRRFSLSSNLVYLTGRPVTYPVSIYYIENVQQIHYSDRNKYRIPDYFRIDFSVNIEGNLKRRKFAHSYWMLNVYNLTGRKNPYSVYFKYEDYEVNGYKLSIFGRPIITLSWHFKLGNYASD